jgi:hypothetical protein
MQTGATRAVRTAASTPATDEGTVTIGVAATTAGASPTTACTSGLSTNFNAALNGVVTASDGSRWTVPAEVTDGRVAVDLYNDCTGPGDNVARYQSQLQTVVIEPDGVEISGFIFADNYYELFVNGTFVARDAIAFTPFNSTAVRFKARYPITYAVKMVDWGSHIGIGMEYARNNVGDGGFIARFSDGTVTSAAWKAAPFYIAPLDDPRCVDIANGRDASRCPDRPACADDNPYTTCKALHFRVPENWTHPTFDDSPWPSATEYRAEEVTTQPAYTRYTRLFEPARFIWSRSLKLDNLVLARYTARAPAK